MSLSINQKDDCEGQQSQVGEEGPPPKKNETDATTSRSRRTLIVAALAIGFFCLVAVGVGAFVLVENHDDNGSNSSSSAAANTATAASTASLSPTMKYTPRPTAPPRPVSNEKIYTSDLEAHSEPEDCWVAVLGDVFDATEFAPFHGGGSNWIYDKCGMDATERFSKHHSKSRIVMNMPHMGAYVLDIDQDEEEVDGVDVLLNNITDAASASNVSNPTNP